MCWRDPLRDQPSTKRELALKKKLLEIPAGSLVEVKLKTKEKLRGRLGDLSNDGFQMKVLNNSTIEDRRLTFDDVAAVRKSAGTSAKKIAGYSALAIGATIAVGAIVMIVAFAAAM